MDIKTDTNLKTNVEMNEKELKTLAAQVLSEYNIIPKEVSIIQGGSIKTVWKFESNKGVFCLKRLKQTLDKALFFS